MADLNVVVVTPERTAVNEQAEFVAVPLYDGELGIAPGHSPLIGRLGYGELRLRTASGSKRFYVDGGFVQVRDNVVALLTERTVAADKIDLAAAEEQLRTAMQRKAVTDDEFAARDKAVEQARAMIRVKKGSS